ncbi:MAG: LysE family transporter [Armatimonadetes bacterium]|nr:LysE family transporter [Armatimonadota bacterium]NIM23546.1 LysE family transporter [Armatimonadota bacterium]NIM67412.1 LysE family transporter [Armatimonadota bacterium]NIM75913.1 LysE family transporter [Armatimonadota bacterium]NIN05598.1 LysE family transporter [Armatimonadota bacterium]
MQDLPAILALFVSAFLIAFSGALVPGPLLAVTITEAMGKGTLAGPLIILGHALLELILVSGVALGLGGLLNLNPVIGTIGLVGGLVLIWMGSGMARNSSRTAQQAMAALRRDGEHDIAPQTGGALRCVLLGAACSVSNPYWTLWWVTVGLALLTKALQISPFAVGAFYMGHILADLVWYWAVAFAVSRGVSWLSIKSYRIVLVACAVFLLAMGIYFAVTGGTTLLTG